MVLKGVSTLAKWFEFIEPSGYGGFNVGGFCRGLRASFEGYNLGNLASRAVRCYEVCSERRPGWSVSVARLMSGVIKVAKWLIALEWPQLKMGLVPFTLIAKGCGIYKEICGMLRRINGFDRDWMNILYFTKKLSAIALHASCIVGVVLGATVAGPITLLLATIVLVASVVLYLIKQVTEKESQWLL